MAKQVTVHKREQWRKWLKENHLKEEKVLLISYKKHTGKSFISHKEQLEEALCFGWIDTTIKKIDENKYSRTFVKRKSNATWSTNTLRYGAELYKKGKMSAFGKEAYFLGKKKKPIDHDIPKTFTVPKDLKLALNKNKAAQENFKAYPPSAKKTHLSWLYSAKRSETREKRIKRIVEAAAKGLRVW